MASTLACDQTLTGEITAGDCTFSDDGTRYDVWQFAGSVGQVIKITVTPLDATLTNPTVELEAPAGDGSQTPRVGGAGAPTVWYRLSSTGTWRVYVGTLNLFAGGRYSLSMSCYADGNAGAAQNCVAQEMACPQVAAWALTATSCRFTNSVQAYADYSLGRLRLGDSVTITGHSNVFDPYLAVYAAGNPKALSSAFGKQGAPDASLQFSAPVTDDYYFVLYGPASSGGAFYVTTKNCLTAPCNAPHITIQPSSAHLKAGDTYAGSVFAIGDRLQFEWFDGIPPDTRTALTPKSGSPALSLPNVTKNHDVWARVSNDCGAENSAPAHITVDCDPPPIVGQPSSAHVKMGGTYVGRVLAVGDALQFEWFDGLPPDTRSPLAPKSGASTISLANVTRDRDVWVRVSSDCGSRNSAAAHITVDQPRRRAARR